MDGGERQWCYAMAGERRGPVALAELKQLLAAGRIHAATPVWRRGMPRWQLLAEVEVLAARLACRQPSPAAPPTGNAWMLWAAALAGVIALLLAAA